MDLLMLQKSKLVGTHLESVRSVLVLNSLLQFVQIGRYLVSHLMWRSVEAVIYSSLITVPL
jgi:hypothetical protein